jgi:putative FmdB family regulatory protein
MPIYEYECTVCGERFELRRNITASDSEIKCPKCGSPNPRRVLSMFGTIFSGKSCAPGTPT